MEYMFMPLKRYFDFSGRSRRKEYWMFFLFAMALYIVAMVLDSMLGLGGTTETYSDFGEGGASVGFNSTGGILTMIVALALLIPSIAVAVRRMHDNDKSGWFVLIPIYGAIGVWFFEGTRGPNRFGSDPKGGDKAEAFT
ncbi:MAG: DUF805 domain-containing protein [Sphingosinicella sp.]|uniref:DUF805 domain-containing protein n=1 Tax=Sphingosinicella sp. TaxID=1917971 RepID=UPI004037ADE7